MAGPASEILLLLLLVFLTHLLGDGEAAGSAGTCEEPSATDPSAAYTKEWNLYVCGDWTYKSGVDKPSRDVWGIKGKKEGYLRWLIDGCDFHDKSCKPVPFRNIEYARFDGYGNSRAFPERGLARSAVNQAIVYSYGDKVSAANTEGLPNPLEISSRLFGSENEGGASTGKTDTFRTVLLHYFGKYVVEEILNSRQAACPMEYLNMDIDASNTHWASSTKQKQMPFKRTSYDPTSGTSMYNQRRQLNLVTPWIDGSAVYGTSRMWANVLRTQHDGSVDPDGKLATDPSGKYPEYNWMRLPFRNDPSAVNHSFFRVEKEGFSASRLRGFGHVNGNENPVIFAISTLWFRWHNQVAQYLRKTHPHWPSEIVFQEARRWVIATMQSIFLYEWYPATFLKPLPAYEAYKFVEDPQIEAMVAAAALRYGHLLIPPVINMMHPSREFCKLQPYSITGNISVGGVRLCQSYWLGQDVFLQELDSPTGQHDSVLPDHVFLGAATQKPMPSGMKMNDDMRKYTYGPMSFSRRDLAAIDVQRGRDWGLPSYEEALKLYGLVSNLERKKLDPNKMANINKWVKDSAVSPQLLQEADDLYKGKPVDLLVGGLLEGRKGYPGPLFEEMARKQFLSIRDGDFFWFENVANKRFSKEEIARIRSVSLGDLIRFSFDLEATDIQERVFFLPPASGRPCKEKFQSSVTCHRPRASCKEGLIKKDEDLPYTCYHERDTSNDPDKMEECTPLQTMSYFDGSGVGVALNCVLYFIVLVALWGLLKFQIASSEQEWEVRVPELLGLVSLSSVYGTDMPTFAAMEYQGREGGSRSVVILFNGKEKTIEVWGPLGGEIRTLKLSLFTKVNILLGDDGQLLIIKVPHEYDMVLEFLTPSQRVVLMSVLADILDMNNIGYLCQNLSYRDAMAQAITYEYRQDVLKRCFKFIILQAQRVYKSAATLLTPNEMHSRYIEVAHVQLNEVEFAEALGMSPKSVFVQKLFNLVDRNKDGYANIHEFLNFFLIFSRGTAKRKVNMLFEMHETRDTRGKLGFEEFKQILINLADISNANVNRKNLSEAVDELMKKAGIFEQTEFRPVDLENVLQSNKELLGYAHLDLYGPNIPESGGSVAMAMENKTQSSFDAAMREAHGLHNWNFEEEEKPQVRRRARQGDCVVLLMDKVKKSLTGDWLIIIERQWENLLCVMIVLFFSGIILLYAASVASAPAHELQSRVFGPSWTLSVLTGSAALYLLCFLPLTNCRNLHTHLQRTFLACVIPFDSMIFIHKVIAWMAFLFILHHVVCSVVTFGIMAGTDPEEVDCMTWVHLETHLWVGFDYLMWHTTVGLTGNAMVMIILVMYFFSLRTCRRKAFRWFWGTHKAYHVLYPLMALHIVGDSMKVPDHSLLLMTPLCIFYLDHFGALSRQKRPIEVIDFELLPSNMIKLVVLRPVNFDFKSGQWVRMASSGLNAEEFHPLTIASSPRQSVMNFYIQVLGPWTYNMRHLYQTRKTRRKKYPKIYLEGPYGSMAQTWRDYEVSVIIAVGEGVLTFISVLDDVVYHGNKSIPIPCRKVYFIWCTSSQKHYEWMIEYLQYLERTDATQILSMHICITEATDKYDLRTIMLYLCEEHFHKVRHRSLFTGLTTQTHFGEPAYRTFFTSVRAIYSHVKNFGVYCAGSQKSKKELHDVIARVNQTKGGYFDLIMVK